MFPDRIVIILDSWQIAPIVLEHLGGNQGTTIGVEMRLDVTRNVAFRGRAERIHGVFMKPGDAPEIDISLIHLGEHFRERIDRTHNRGIEHDDFIELRQMVPPGCLQGGFVGPSVEPFVLTYNQPIRPGLEFLPTRLIQRSVNHNAQFVKVFPHVEDHRVNVVVDHPVPIIEKENPEPLGVFRHDSHVSPSIICLLLRRAQSPGHPVAFPKCWLIH